MKLGDKIVALHGHPMGFFRAGQEFTCEQIRLCQCNQHFLIDIGKRIGPHNGTCTKTNRTLYSANTVWFHIDNFVSIQNADISELTNILQK